MFFIQIIITIVRIMIKFETKKKICINKVVLTNAVAILLELNVLEADEMCIMFLDRSCRCPNWSASIRYMLRERRDNVHCTQLTATDVSRRTNCRDKTSPTTYNKCFLP